MKKNFLINGRTSETINPFDRGLSYGDGVFRTFLVKNGNPINWDMHYLKLSDDAHALQIKAPTKKDLFSDIKKLFDDKKTYICKIIITRGVSDQGYRYNKNINSTRILLKIKYKNTVKKLYFEGVRLEICKTRTSHNEIYKGAKHLNRIDNVLAKAELKNSTFDGIMLDSNNYINECISSNIFARFGKVVISPKQENSGVSGVCKQIVVENVHSLGYSFSRENIDLKRLKKADEVIITNSIFGALYVNQIEEKKWKDGAFASLIREFIINPKIII